MRAKLTAACLVLLAWIVAPAIAAHAGAEQQTSKPARTAKPADRLLQSRVEAALSSAADLRGRKIMTQVQDAVVHVSGSVETPTELQSVGAIVRAIPNVKTVRFSIRVEPPPAAAPGGRGAPSGRGTVPSGRGAVPNPQR